MTAPKGWEKITETLDVDSWKNQQSLTYITMYRNSNSKFETIDYDVYVVKDGPKVITSKKFNTRSEAEAFAQRYMRSHPNG